MRMAAQQVSNLPTDRPGLYNSAVSALIDSDRLIERIDALLPQTQCTQCGYAGCEPYARAIVHEAVPINRCPPGGQAGVVRLAELLQQPAPERDTSRGETRARHVARIDPQLCIGCTKCITACPLDAIIGAPKRMHTVIDALCSGCDLCVPACPVDCITMDPDAPAWSEDDIALARVRHRHRATRLVQERHDDQVRLSGLAVAKLAALTEEPDDPATARKRAVVEAAIRRARERLAGSQT